MLDFDDQLRDKCSLSHTDFSKLDKFCIKHFTSCRQYGSLCVIGHAVTFPIFNMLLKFPYQIFTFFMQEESEQEQISLHKFTPHGDEMNLSLTCRLLNLNHSKRSDICFWAQTTEAAGKKMTIHPKSALSQHTIKLGMRMRILRSDRNENTIMNMNTSEHFTPIKLQQQPF